MSSASMAKWLGAWDTLAMMRLWGREVVSSASMAEWLGGMVHLGYGGGRS